MAKGISVVSEETYWEDLSLEHSIVKSTGRCGRVSKGQEKGQLVRQEENQKHQVLEVK